MSNQTTQPKMPEEAIELILSFDNTPKEIERLREVLENAREIVREHEKEYAEAENMTLVDAAKKLQEHNLYIKEANESIRAKIEQPTTHADHLFKAINSWEPPNMRSQLLKRKILHNISTQLRKPDYIEDWTEGMGPRDFLLYSIEQASQVLEAAKEDVRDYEGQLAEKEDFLHQLKESLGLNPDN